MKRPLSTAKPLLVIVAAVMSVTSLVFSTITWTRVARTVDLVRESHVVSTMWRRLLSEATEIETGQRGFHITGDERYLEPLVEAERRIPDLLRELRSAEAEGTARAGEVEMAAGRIRTLLVELRELVSIRRREGRDAGRVRMEEGTAKHAMDALRDELTEIARKQDALISERERMMANDLRWGYGAALGSGVVALGAGTLAILMLRESLTQLRREQRLLEEKRRAENADRQKSVFLATMSHEIRTPMNAILGFGELLEGEVETERQKRYTQAILSGGRSLLQIINDILDISKIEAGMMDIKPEPTNLATLGDFLGQLFTGQAAKSGVTLQVETADDLPASLVLDGLRLRQVMLNVVGNAIKFTQKGFVAVRFKTTSAGGRSRVHLRIEVEDSGVGIPADQLNDIFRPFVQAGRVESVDHRGTGLGLAIVKRLTELMGGSILVTSEPGRGTTFQLDFPNVEVSARLPLGDAADEAPVDFNELRPATVLMADDNPTNRDLVAGIFEDTHHRLILAADGAEAVTAVEAEHPDVVLMDIRMPGMDGRQALAALRATPDLELLPVIAVTASSLSNEEAGLRRAFDGYVRKPFSRAELYRELALFIPRTEVPPARSDTEDSGVPGPAEAGAWRELAVALRKLEESPWPKVRDGMSMTAVRSFASEVGALGKQAGCAPAIDWAAKVTHEAENFLLSELEETVSAFPLLIASVSARAAS